MQRWCKLWYDSDGSSLWKVSPNFWMKKPQAHICTDWEDLRILSVDHHNSLDSRITYHQRELCRGKRNATTSSHISVWPVQRKWREFLICVYKIWSCLQLTWAVSFEKAPSKACLVGTRQGRMEFYLRGAQGFFNWKYFFWGLCPRTRAVATPQTQLLGGWATPPFVQGSVNFFMRVPVLLSTTKNILHIVFDFSSH